MPSVEWASDNSLSLEQIDPPGSRSDCCGTCRNFTGAYCTVLHILIADFCNWRCAWWERDIHNRHAVALYDELGGTSERS